MADRSGQRKPRVPQEKRRIPSLGYYFIVTDTKETEQNYLLGLRESIPEALRGKLVIKVSKAKPLIWQKKHMHLPPCYHSTANPGLCLIVIR